MHTIFSLWFSVAHAGPITCTDCTFVDTISGETRLTTKGPSPSSLKYLVAEDGGYVIAAKYVDQFQEVCPYDAKEFSDGGDQAYDDDDGDPWWLVVLQIILAAAKYVEDLGLNGAYDGYLTVDGAQVPAFVKLDSFGGDVRGYIELAGPLVVDGGICGSYELPPGTALKIRATEGGPAGVAVNTAAGSTTRRVADAWLFDIDATATFDLALMNDRETLTGTIALVLTDPCADPTPITGRFLRRPVF